MYGMNRILTEIGWAAVAGLYRQMLLWNSRPIILVIASDIRQ
jgi:hypothetical protein